jgi:ABC-2 type transport system permease protein
MTSLVAPAAGVHAREARAEILRALRLPQFVVPTIALPAAFYALFALGLGSGNADAATRLLATFGVFAMMGPALFGFGANVAAERESGLVELKRLSPMPASAHIVSKLAATVALGALSLVLVYGLAVLGGVRLEPAQWAMLAGVHLASVVPFGLIGLGFGYRLGQKGAIAMANIVFLGLAVGGGLWMPITMLPEVMQGAAWAMPSFHLGELAPMVAGRSDTAALGLHAAALALLTAAAALFAWTGHARQSA